MAATTDTDATRVPVPARPLLPGFYRVIPMGADALQLRSAGRVVRVGGPGVGQFGPGLLGALDGRDSVATLVDRLALEPGPAADLVRNLHAQGIVLDAADEPDLERAGGAFGPGEVYAQMSPHGAAVEAAVAASRVAVVGLGPVGRAAARHLAGAGVGELVLVDAGPVTALDQSALAAGSADIGRSRVDVTAEECLQDPASGPATVVRRAPEPFAVEPDVVDLVVVEVDEARQRSALLNRRCVTTGVAALFYSAGTFQGVIGPLVAKGSQGCHQCLVDRERSHIRHYDEHLAYERWVVDGGTQAAAMLSGFASVVAGLVALEVLRRVGGFQEPLTSGGVLVAELRTSLVRRESLLAVPGCPACGDR